MFGAGPKQPVGSSLFSEKKMTKDSKNTSTGLFGMPAPGDLNTGGSGFSGFGFVGASSSSIPVEPVFGNTAKLPVASSLFGKPAAETKANVFGAPTKLFGDKEEGNPSSAAPLFGNSATVGSGNLLPSSASGLNF